MHQQILVGYKGNKSLAKAARDIVDTSRVYTNGRSRENKCDYGEPITSTTADRVCVTV